MSIVHWRGWTAISLLLLSSFVASAQDQDKQPAAESPQAPQKSEPPPVDRGFQPSEKVSADQEVDFPADI